MKLVPLGDRVVLKQLVAEETTKSGIVLPGQSKEKPQQAEVVAVGPGGVVDGKEIKMEVKVGDNVIYSKYAGTEVKLDEEEYIIVKQNDILAVIDNWEPLKTDVTTGSKEKGWAPGGTDLWDRADFDRKLSFEAVAVIKLLYYKWRQWKWQKKLNTVRKPVQH